MTASATGSTELHPPRWQPAPMRWHNTPVTWRESWRLALGLPKRVRERTIMQYLAADLPGQDDVLVARLPMAKFVIVRSPELVRQILVTEHQKYVRGAEFDMLAVVFGQGLVTQRDDRLYHRNKRLVQPIFARSAIDQFDVPMVEAAQETVRRLRAAGEPVDVGVEMTRLMLDIVARTMFGTDVDGPISKFKLERLLKLFGVGVATNVSRPLRALSTWLVRRTEKPERRAGSRLPVHVMRVGSWMMAPHIMYELRGIEKAVAGIISDHREGRITRKDNLLGLLMAATDPETGHSYTDLEIRDELMTFIGAGMETSATALTWVWKLLDEHPEVRARLYEELDTVLSGRTPTAADVDKLVWTKAIFLETMRLHPPIMALSKVAVAEDVLAGYRIKPGTTLMISMHGVHGNPRVWDRAREFDPTRYLPENMTRPHREASLAFGAGKRICIAQNFATMEVVLSIATIAQQVDLRLATNEPIRPQLSFIGAPDKPLLMRAVPRDQAPVDR
ncbi:cytochrome P450 [Nocardia sp. CDC160]|uniref:cytochrome P450 n=1 Tax=Nocardia sp. CDC160 TaxID=3112166 RepID=UPI002DB9F853|nr:cytochrome P450 [Nocardia sp. CDC160]MEC3916066.1 cytochrome P450 [Nocardia sp. CDC160]